MLAGRDILLALEEEAEFLAQTGARVLVPGAALKDAGVMVKQGGVEVRMLLDDVSLQGLRVDPTPERDTPVVIYNFSEHRAMS